MTSQTTLENLACKLPKAELHVHIEGTLEPELMLALANKNRVRIPYSCVDDIRNAYQFSNLQSFLDLYYLATQVFKTRDDFYQLTMAYLNRVHQDNVKHVEIFFDAQAHTERGITFGTIVEGIYTALEEANKKFQMTSRLIMCFVRHYPIESAEAALDEALKYKKYIFAVGLDSTEKDNPPSKYVRLFARAREEGFLTVAHVGEEGPADDISQALDLLKIKRIDHGVQCVQDPELVRRLAKEQIPLTVCPISNIKLKVFPKMSEHNIRTLVNSGLLVTVNSDDPSYFGGYINDNYIMLIRHLNFTQDEIIQLCKNSFTASFLDPQTKMKYINQIEECMASYA